MAARLTKPPSPVERFEAAVVKTDTCWNWQQTLSHKGYGDFFPTRKKRVPAHRWSYEHFVGPIPEGLVLDHLCRVRHCVNPEHLEAVTPQENTLRGVGPSAVNASKTQCLRGHALEGNNLIVRATGRGCRACQDERRANAVS